MSEAAVETLADFVFRLHSRWGHRSEFFTIRRHGQLDSYSCREIMDQVLALALVLEKRGVKKGDRLAILSENRPEWHVADWACQVLGAVSVPIFPTLPAEQVSYILNDSGAQWVFYSDDPKREELESHNLWASNPPQLVALDSDARAAKGLTLEEVLAEGGPLRAGRSLEDFRGRVFAPDTASILYTSGTTGDPKGVILTHRNFTSNFLAACEVYPGPGGESEQSVCFLPLSHVFARTTAHTFLHLGIALHYVPADVEQIRAAFLEKRPTVFASVPLIFENAHRAILKVREGMAGLQAKIFDWAIDVGRTYVAATQKGSAGPVLAVRRAVAQRLVYHKFQARFGGRLHLVIAGGAPLPEAVETFFHAVGVGVFVGYGLTETAPMLTVNRPGVHRIGSAGKPAPGVQLKIAEDGEVLAKSPGIMQGYWRKKEATAEVFTEDGWFCTGDLGEIDEDGFLFITGRKKDIVVTADGVNIAPVPIEQLLAGAPAITQAVVVGDDRPFLSALLVPDAEYFKDLGPTADLVGNAKVQAEIEDVVQATNRLLAGYEQIRAFRLVAEAFTLENGLLTPTMKVRRRRVKARYEELVESMYPESSED